MPKKLYILDAKEALKRFKAEAAAEVGIQLKPSYKRDVISESPHKK